MKRSSGKIYLTSLALILSIYLLLPSATALATGYTFTTIDVPGFYSTQAFGINDFGDIVGVYSDGTGTQHGFLDTKGNFTTIDVPGAINTSAFGINDSGDIVGVYAKSGALHGFLYVDGNFTTIDVPGAIKTEAIGINDSGSIVGWYTDASNRTHGFLYVDGSITPIDVPGAIGTQAFGINDSGDIVGYYYTLANAYGFFYSHESDPSPIQVPGFYITEALGINDPGTIVGVVIDPGTQGFLYVNGAFSPILFPGALSTSPTDINDRGAIVGTYRDESTLHGFLATPAPVPEPVSIDIKPGDDSNCLNLNEHGVIPVAIFGSVDLDVNEIDPASLSLQGLSLKMVGKTNRLLTHFEDIDGDGYTDLIAQFQDSDGWTDSGDGYATLTGHLYDGTPIEGSDSICIVP